MNEVTVYGADWCPMTQGTLAHLRSLGVPHSYINIDQDPEAREWVREQNLGSLKKPTLRIADRIVTEPSDDELDRVLASAGAL